MPAVAFDAQPVRPRDQFLREPALLSLVLIVDDDDRAAPQGEEADPAALILTCANCGAPMDERKCKLICRGCGYFLSCSDYY